MNIGGLYNASSMFQSMYNTNSYGSSSMASLTNNILGASSASGMYSSLSDYSLIKSGSYNKLMNAYYDTVGSDEKEVTSSKDILAKLKETYTPSEDKKTVAETEDGKVIEKAEATDKQDETAPDTSSKKTDVISDLMRRNRAISYTNMGGVIKNMPAPSFDYIV